MFVVLQPTNQQKHDSSKKKARGKWKDLMHEQILLLMYKLLSQEYKKAMDDRKVFNKSPDLSH